ncbi:peptide ABC transporter substrate-binding protein [Mucisphaera sp.]|uniref:peptide ABC transporter substrate-binding protein n=1 Tax=Mucisphaera sp. TaxID=2913024 RepID=UPI003D108B1F
MGMFEGLCGLASKVRWVRVMLVGALVGLVPGCGEREPEADLIFMSAAAHITLDPAKMSWSHDIRVASALYDPLVRMDFNSGEVEPAVAESWAVSEDGLTYTFTLREDAKWANGDPVTSEDFIYAWRRVSLPDTAASYVKLMYVIDGVQDFYAWRTEQISEYARVRNMAGGAAGEAAAEAAEVIWQEAQAKFASDVGLEAPDPRTLVVRLEQPTPYFLQMIGFATFMPVHIASVEEATTLNTTTGMVQVDSAYWRDPERVISNGPYVIEDGVFKRYLRMHKNANYWNAEAVKSETLLEKINEDPQSAFLAYSGGDVDISIALPSLGPLPAELVRDESRTDVHTVTAAGTYFYNFNCLPTLPDGSPNPLADPRVRVALSMGIDRQQIVGQVTRMDQPIARSFVPPGAVAGYEPPVETGVVFDPEGAKALLAEAGYPNGEGLDGLSILYNTGAGHEEVAIAIAAMWERELGVVVTTEGVEVQTFSDRVNRQDYSIARSAWFGDYMDPTTWLDKNRANNGNNDAKWNSPLHDGLLDEAQTIRDPEARFAKLAEAEAVFNAEQPIAPIFHYRLVYLFDTERVKGVELNPWARWRFDRIWVERGE